MGVDFSDWLLGIYMAVVVSAFLEERKRGLWNMVCASPSGRTRLAAWRLGAVALAAGLGAVFLTLLELRLGHTQSTEHLLNTSAENFAALVEERSGGAIHIDVYPSETLGTNTELAEACSEGDVDLYISATGQ